MVLTYPILINVVPKLVWRTIQVDATELGCKIIQKVIVVRLMTRPRFYKYCIVILITSALLRVVFDENDVVIVEWLICSYTIEQLLRQDLLMYQFVLIET